MTAADDPADAALRSASLSMGIRQQCVSDSSSSVATTLGSPLPSPNIQTRPPTRCLTTLNQSDSPTLSPSSRITRRTTISPPPYAVSQAAQRSSDTCPIHGPFISSTKATMSHATPSSGPTPAGSSSTGTTSDRPNSSIISRVGPFVSRIFSPPLKPLTPKIDIVFHTGIVDMIGQPLTSSHYSLSGYVRVSLPALPQTCNDRLRAVHEATIVVEGRSEYADKCGRYTPLRLFTTTLPLFKEFNPMLVPSHDTEFPNRDNLTVAIPFDLRIPGWVPPTHESGLSRTSYGVIASITVGWQGNLSWRLPGQHGPHQLDNTYTPTLDGVERTRTSFKEFIVRRHRLDPKVLPPWRRSHSYVLRPAYGDPIDCSILTPHWCDIHGGRQQPIRLYIRLRKAKKTEEDIWRQRRANASETSGDNADPEPGDVAMPSSSPVIDDDNELGPMRLVAISVVFHETTLWSSEPLANFMRLNPIPKEQPERGSDRYKLLGKSIGSGRPSTAGLKSYKLTVTSNCGNIMHAHNKVFNNGGMVISSDTEWKGIPVVTRMPAKNSSSNTPLQFPSPDIDSPFIRVKHSVATTFVFRSSDDDEETITIDTPLRFATSFSTYPSPMNNPPPAFTELFFENGEQRECDPLPVYSASPDTSTEGVESQAPNPTEPTSGNQAETTAADGNRSESAPIATDDSSSTAMPMEGVESTVVTQAESPATNETEPTASSTIESAATNEINATPAASTTEGPSSGVSEPTPVVTSNPSRTASRMEGVESASSTEAVAASTTDPPTEGGYPNRMCPATLTTPLSPLSGLALSLSSSSLASAFPPASIGRSRLGTWTLASSSQIATSPRHPSSRSQSLPPASLATRSSDPIQPFVPSLLQTGSGLGPAPPDVQVSPLPSLIAGPKPLAACPSSSACPSPLSPPPSPAIASVKSSPALSDLALDSPRSSTRASSLELKDNLSPSLFSWDLVDDSGPSSPPSSTRRERPPLLSLEDSTRQPKRRRRDSGKWIAEASTSSTSSTSTTVSPPCVTRRVTRSSSSLASQAGV